MTYKVPNNVVNKSLYFKIYQKLKAQHEKDGKRWGAYSSGQLVKEYKAKGGKYSGEHSKNSSNLARWYKEKWVDACEYSKGKIKSCGRKNVESGKFPYCRPLKRINSKTPKTVKELSKNKLNQLCSIKRENPKNVIYHKSVSKYRTPRKSRIQSKSRKSRTTKRNIKLISIVKSPKLEKKLRATFIRNNRQIHTDFGAAGMSDFTKHKDRDRRQRYITRHSKDLRTNDPTRAGFLSMFVLWNKPLLQPSIADYKKRLSVYNKTGKFPTKIN